MFVLLIIPFNSQDLLIVSYSAISTAVLYALYAFMWTVVVTEEEKNWTMDKTEPQQLQLITFISLKRDRKYGTCLIVKVRADLKGRLWR